MTKKKKILVTSALPYANGPLHLGHIAGAYLPADIYVRFERLRGNDVVYICGSDEHGVPITVTADNEGVSPQDVVDRYHLMNKESFQKLGINFDNYSRTSLPIHHETAQEFFSILHQKDDFVEKEADQFYSEKTKRFLPDRYVEGICPYCKHEKARGDQCDHCGKWLETGELVNPHSKIDSSVPVLKKTKHWYFPMGRFASDWKDWFEKKSWKENVHKYCMGWYNEGLGDRPITRDLHWGVDVPLDETEGKVLYVWFDAPIGYISSTKEWAQIKGNPELWKEYWCDDDTKLVHFIGKDNIVFHAILFPMMLKEVGGYVLPDAIPANEYLTIEGRKISTSQNYAIWLKDYLEIFPPDPLRYTLAANAPETKDTDFSWKQLQSRNNDELADILGNFINRTLTFIHKYYDGKVPPKGQFDDMDQQMMGRIVEARTKIENCFANYEVRNGIRHFMDLCRSANKYFNDKAPWETRSNNSGICSTTLNICVQVTRAFAVMMAPVLPNASGKLQKMLNIKNDIHWDGIGKLQLPDGHELGTPEILFSKIEDDVIENEIEKLNKIGENLNSMTDEKKKKTDLIDFDTFQKIEMLAGKVEKAEKVKNSDRLLKMLVNLGKEKRQIVAGIAGDYSPDDIIDKMVIVVANLETAKIRGEESQGMLLAVKTEEGLSLLIPDKDVAPGKRIS